MGVTQLIYHSRKQDLGPAGVFGILDEARTANERDGVTGVLVFSHDFFLQVIEGSREQITRTFLRIAGDRRHSDVALMSVGEVEKRSFERWSMGALNSDSRELRGAMKDILPGYEFTPPVMTAQAAMTLLQRMVKIDRTVDY